MTLTARVRDTIRIAKQVRNDNSVVRLESLRLRAEASATRGASERLRRELQARRA